MSLGGRAKSPPITKCWHVIQEKCHLEDKVQGDLFVRLELMSDFDKWS